MRYLFIVLSILLVSMAWCDDNINITISPSMLTYQSFYPSYIDPTHTGGQPYMFSLTLTNQTPTGATISHNAYYLKVSFSWNGDPLVQNITVSPDANSGDDLIFNQPRIYTNNQIIAEGGRLFDCDMNFDDVLNGNSQFKDFVLNTGRFPDGVYTMSVQAFNNDHGSISNEAILSIQVTTPVSISLIYPGAAVGMPVQDYYQQFPSFVWVTNQATNHFKLYQIDRTDVTPEEIEHLPVYYEQDVTGGMMPYPPAAPPLRAGNLYAWQVTSIINPTMGGEVIKSPVFIFRVTAGNDPQVYTQIVNQLLQNLHIEGLEAIDQLLNSGYTPTGNATYQGQPVSIDTILQIIQRINRGELVPKRITVE